MKRKLHFIGLIPILLFFTSVLFSTNSYGQIPLLGWDCNPIINGANLFGPSPFNPTTVAANVTGSGIIRGAGISTTGTGANRAFGGVGFNVVDAAAAIAANKFIAFTIAANSGYNLSLSSINPFDYRRSATGPPSALIQYSINGGTYIDITTISFPTTASSGASAGPVDLSIIPALQNLPSTSTVSFRIVPYGATGATGTWYIFDVLNSTVNDFVVNGTVTSAAVPTLTSTALNFPNTCLGSNNILPTTITGSNLTGTSVLVGPFSSYGFSTNPAGPFDPSVSLTYVGNSLSSTVYVQYLPTVAGTNNGNIALSGGGASGTIATTGQAFAVPTVTAISTPSPATVCAGSSVTLTGGGATTYTWSNGVQTPTDAVAFVPTSSSTYTVTGTTSGCSSTSTVVVTVNPAPSSPVITATPTAICIGGNSDLNAVSTGNTIRWFDALTAGTLLTTVASATNYNVTPATTTTYYAEAVSPAGGTQTFNYTGSAQTFIVPAGVTSMDMECWGAQGGANWINNTNFGGYSKGTIAVTPGETLTIYVGNQPTTIAGGFNGGGAGDGAGRAGGGASDVRQGGTGLNNRIIVAAGGGGAGYWSSLHVVGGVGGGANLSGGDGYRNTIADPGGKGATVLAAGPDGTCASFNNINMAGAFGQGGSPATFGCGCEGYGGGGGWYGGAGSGNCRGGGGGSGYIIPSATNLVATSGVRVGDGQVILTWTGSGCASNPRTPVTVTVNPIPSVTAGSSPSPATVCSGSSVTLTGGGATTYTWTDGVNTPTDGVSFIPSASSTYTVTGTTAGCSSTATLAVTVNPTPTVTASSIPSPATVCSGSSVTLTGGGATTYTWTDGVNTATDGVSFVPASSSTYTVTGTTAGCSSTATLAVTVNPIPTVTAISIPSPATICAGGNVTLNGGGATTYTWTNGVNTPTDGVSFVPASSSTYTVTGTSAGCSSTATLAVTVNPFPTVTAFATPNDTVCAGSPVTLQGGGANTYTWNANATLTSDTTLTPAVAGTYTVVGTDAIGCSASSTIVITTTQNPYNIVIPNPELLYYKFDGVGTSVPNQALTPPPGTATATIMGGLTQGSTGQTGGALVGSGISSTTDYLNTGYAPNRGGGSWTISFWSAGFGSTAALYYIFGDANTASFRCFTNGVAGAGNWILRGAGLTDIYINGGAQSTPTLNTYVYDATLNNVKGYLNGVLVSTVAQTAPNLTGAGPLKVMGYSANIGAPLGGKLDEFRLYNRALNAAEVLQLMATSSVVSATVTPTTICAGSTATLTGTGATTYSWNPGIMAGSPVNVNPISTTTYTVVGADANGCTGTNSVTLNVNPLPAVTATPATQTLCQNASATISGGGATSYVWTGGISDATPFNVTSSATYTVTGTDGNNCSNTATAVVNMNAAPLVTAGATPTTTCNNTVVTPTGGGASTYTWSGGLTDNTPFIASATATYTVTGTDGIGCSATSSVTVTVTPASGTIAPATSNQSQSHNDDFNVNYSDASCNLIATVDDGAGGNILGLTTATVNVEATAGVHNGQPFVRRWYQITPTSNGSADVILYINQADFNDYNAAVTAPYLPLPTSGNNADPNIANIRITKNSDAGLGNSPVVITPTVNWNGTYWELSFNTPSFSQFRVHSVNPGNVPLPATVTNFSGRKMSTSDMLEWTTASEQNNAYFNLQHGTDGINFTTIAKVNSQAINGNSSSILNYSFENTKPQLGHNYYRLQQVDIDNHSTMNAKVVDIIWGTNGSTVSIYPNPTQDVLNIDLYTTKVQNTTVKVLDMSGRIVKQIQGRSEAGMNKLSISLGEIASGVYTVQVFENDNLTHVSKVKKND
jgi:hypothetical protein